ncbi:MAG: cell division protein FtsZ [Selenomonadaceae bacterium]|nr:cell division protein FtsZ [Selenomonadaceae bacterium]
MGADDAALKKAVENLRLRKAKNNETESAAIRKAVVKIKVFGVGGGGNNVVKRLEEGGLSDIELVAVNTDASALSSLSTTNIRCIQIGADLTHGKGTGGNPELGEQAAKMDAEKIRNMMKGADMIFITAAMGGGVGTGAAPVVAKIAKELNLLTVGVVTVPFKFEGIRKQKKANEGIIKMQSYMDALISVKNDNLMKLPENKSLSIVDAFHAADSVLRQAIKCVAELILTIGFVNVDFADVTTIFQQSESSDALLGIGRSNISAVKAVQQAVESPLIDRNLQGARGMILNITGDESLSLYEVNEAASFIYSQTDADVNIIFGAVVDNSMNGVVQATIIATDFVDSLALKSPTVTVPKSTVTVSKGFNLEVPTPAEKKEEKGNIISSFDFFNRRRDN